MQNTGAKIEYQAVDVRDDVALTKVIEGVYSKYGRIDGVIHGAGVIEDAYVKDKTLESFKRVVETKVLGALTLAKVLRFETLKFLFLFSSIVGRTGNAGQSDYVAANEILNKLALSLNAKSTTTRIASLMWGPWRGGMAQPELEAIFAKYGWAMIDGEQGKKAFMDELLFGDHDDVEVLLVAEVGCEPQLRGPRLYSAKASAPSAGITEISLSVGTATDLYLNDHTFDGVPVMPMAMVVELMMESAESAFPGFRAEEIFDLDIPSGIVFEVPVKPLSIRTELLRRSELDLTISTVLGVGAPMKRSNFRLRFAL